MNRHPKDWAEANENGPARSLSEGMCARERAEQGKPALDTLPRPPVDPDHVARLKRENARLREQLADADNRARWAEIALRGSVPLAREVACYLLAAARVDGSGEACRILHRMHVRGWLDADLVADLPPRPTRSQAAETMSSVGGAS